MDPIVPPKLISTEMTGSESHCDDNNRYNARHVCRDPDVIPLRIMWSVAKTGLDAKDICHYVNDSSC
jgi:hypothetical protein